MTSNASSLERADAVAFVSGSKVSRISRLPGGGIKLEAPDGDALEKLTCLLLDELDKRYPYVIPFRPVMGLKSEMIYSAKMAGKHIPLRNYFD